jgi:hypothetical protein
LRFIKATVKPLLGVPLSPLCRTRSKSGSRLGVLGETRKQLKQFGWINEITCPSEKILSVAEFLNWRVQTRPASNEVR